MSGGGLPATPREIQLVLRTLSDTANACAGEAQLPEDVRTTGRVLAGLVAGFDGTVYPVPSDPPADLGYRVAQSLAKGGTPWV